MRSLVMVARNGLDMELATRIAASASRAFGMWTTEAGEKETYVVELASSRRLAVVRDLGVMRTAHLMQSEPLVLMGEKGPLDPRLLGPRIASFARAHPALVTILDVAPRIEGERTWWTGDWGGVETSAYVEKGSRCARVTQREDCVLVRVLEREMRVTQHAEIADACIEIARMLSAV